MCGLIGFLASKPKFFEDSRKLFLTEGLYLDTLRGHHATGIYLIKENTDCELYKRAIPGYELINSKKYKKIIGQSKDIIGAIGHNRFATTGGLDDIHAHPFNYKNIVLAHNGTLRKNSFHTFPGKENTSLRSIDSYRIASAIATWGSIPTLEKLEGAYALTWHDNLNNKFYIAKNSERSLFCGVNYDKSEFFWASEQWMLEVLKGRMKIGLDIKAIPNGILHEFDFNNSNFIINCKKTPFTVHTYSYNNNYSSSYNNNYSMRRNRGKNVTKTLLQELGYDYEDLLVVKVSDIRPNAHNNNTATVEMEYARVDELAQIANPKIKFTFTQWGCDDHNIYNKGDLLLVSLSSAYRLRTGSSQAINAINFQVDIQRKANDDDKNLWFAVKERKVNRVTWEHKALQFNSRSNNKVQFLHYFIDGDVCSKEDFERAVKEGCLMCNDPIDSSMENGEDLTWTHNKKPICEDCVKILDNDITGYVNAF